MLAFTWRPLVAALLLGLLAGCTGSVPAGDESPLPTPQSERAAPATADLASAFTAADRVSRERVGVVGVAVVDRATGKLYRNGEAHDRVRSASIVKLAIAAHHFKAGSEPLNSTDVRRMITESDNASAYALFASQGERIIASLSQWDTRAQYSPWWGHTLVTAAGEAKYLAALADGDVLPERPTRTLLNLMREVTPAQRWGLAEALPPVQRSSVPVKNGWYAWSDLGTSSINCLALLPFAGEKERLAVAVITSFPSERGLRYGRSTCRLVGRALVS